VLGPGGVVAAPVHDIRNDALLVHSDRQLASQQGESHLLALAQRIPDVLKDMKLRDFDMRMKEFAGIEAREAELKKDREAEADERRSELLQKEVAKKAKELQRSRGTKKQMAEETKKQAAEVDKREKVRYEKGAAERKAFVEWMLMDTKLRDEDEIANERPEGSSMSKGGKTEFVNAAKNKEDLAEFVP